MKTRFLYQARALLVAAVLPLVAFSASESPSLLLQKGIYAEEIERNLDSAIKIYLQIGAEAAANRSVVAQAQYRLAMCYQKKGNKEQAIGVLNDLLKQFPAEAALGQKARELLAGMGQAPASNVTTRRVLGNASYTYGAVTPDGRHLRRVDWHSGSVMQFEFASKKMTKIADLGPWCEGEEFFSDEYFSRDGKQIAYTSYRTADRINLLRIGNLDGSGLRILIGEKDLYVRLLDWSADAAFFLAIVEGNPGTKWVDELALISAADGSRRVLGDSDWWGLKIARFSPNGRFAAYSIEREGNPPHGDLFLVNVEDRNRVVVAEHPAEDQLLGWTPDGRSLVFLSDRSGTWDMWIVDINEGKQHGEPRLLKKGFDWSSEVLGFALDGSVFYRTFSELGRLFQGAVDLETGKVLEPPAAMTTRIAALPNYLKWSPDGSNLAYLLRRASTGSGDNVIAIRSAATGEERLLSPGLRDLNQLFWAPDGRSLIAITTRYGKTGIVRIDAETGESTQLAPKGRVPQLCPDGKTLVFRTEGGWRSIKKRNLDTGEESEVVKTESLLFDLSPDGREVVYQEGGVLKVVSLNGGEPRELCRDLSASIRSWYAMWTRDGRNIIAYPYPWGANPTQNNRNRVAFGGSRIPTSEIWRIPAQGGAPLKLDLSVPKMTYFALHPDNRRFALGVIEESKSELWVLESILPPARLAGNP